MVIFLGKMHILTSHTELNVTFVTFYHFATYVFTRVLNQQIDLVIPDHFILEC